MNKSDKQAIIARVEQVRVALHLNKSQFAARVGLTPQTYNNFIGAQASKPNVELLYGCLNAFQANPVWLLRGEGEMFLNAFDRLKRHVTATEAAMEAGPGLAGNIMRALAGISTCLNELAVQIAEEPEAPRPLPMEPSGPDSPQRYP